MTVDLDSLERPSGVFLAEVVEYLFRDDPDDFRVFNHMLAAVNGYLVANNVRPIGNRALTAVLADLGYAIEAGRVLGLTYSWKPANRN
ncbi:hypothetical protein [Streptomyces sp. NPDC054834]